MILFNKLFFVSLLGLLFFPKMAFPIDKVVGFGDSITAGYPYITTNQNGSSVGGYEPVLAGLLNNAGYQAVVLNYGHPGETTDDGLRRIQGVLDKEKPQEVLVMEGTNDLWFEDTYTVMAHLASIVNKVIASGASPVLATITPDSRDNGKPITEMNNRIRIWAAANNVRLADQYAALINNWSALNCGDKLHPNYAGYNIIAQVWFSSTTLTPPEPPKPIIVMPFIMLLLNK